MDAFYCGPAKMHYRNYRFYIPETRNYRTTNSAKFFPAHCRMPAIEPADTIRLAAQDLITALHNKHSRAPINLDHSHTSALRQLAEIFNTLETVNDENDAAPRVQGQLARVQPSTSHDATTPRVVAQQPRIHQRTTRANKPMPTIVEEADEMEPPPASGEKSRTTKHFERRTSARQAAREQRQAENKAIEAAIDEVKNVEAPPPITGRPQRSIAQYRREKAAKTFNVLQPVPITQEEEDEISFANALFASLPKLHTTKSPCNISSAAIYHIMGTSLENPTAGAFVPAHFGVSKAYNVPLEAYANAVVHPITKETITKYDKLANDPVTKDVWTAAFCKELGRLAQGWDSTEGTNTIFFMTKEEIARIPKDRTVTYARIVVDYRPQKADPNRVRITVGGNLFDYPGELTTRTAGLTTAKILWNSVLSTPDAKYACADVGNFYLATPMERYEYMRIKREQIPDAFMEKYDLWDKVHNGYVYCEIRRGMYGLPQAGIIANQLLKKRLAKYGYYKMPHTPGLWHHDSRPISFTLVVDDFGIKYVGKEHLEHLLDALKADYEVSTDYKGALYCGITLQWNYEKRYVDISMPGYVEKQLLKYKHPKPAKPVHTPWEPTPFTIGNPNAVAEVDDSPPLDAEGIKRIQQVVGSFMYYCRATDPTIPVALNELASRQNKATGNLQKRCNHFLDYMATHPDAVIRYYASDMVLNVHSDASYHSAPNARSRAAGYFFLGSVPKPNQPIKLNGAINVICSTLKFVAASAAEAELGALFNNAKEAKILRLTPEELGHPQPPTPIHIDNSTTIGIVNNTIKRQKSRSMEMRYFWLLDGKVQKLFNFEYHPGLENLADYPSKHHSASHHTEVRPYYVHTINSPRYLMRAAKPSVRRGCVKSGKGSTFNGKHPLPKLTRVGQSSLTRGVRTDIAAAA